ncbi:uncharacterized protein LOC142563945 [Dermacentor variabilis]|uniref:uncharacterized protein LOC142563945 n=1 Tax=Dermacentor variabilis TaxID=34621 RepID=UPI003F5B09DC
MQIQTAALHNLRQEIETAYPRPRAFQKYIPKMYREVFALLLVGIAIVGVQSQGRKRKCRANEEFVKGYWPRHDVFCKPWLALPTELNKIHWCVCKEGYVRNAWGSCVKLSECFSCSHQPNQDFDLCVSACPIVCGKPVPKECELKCTAGCACAPGYVRHPSHTSVCVPAIQCPPQCPRFSTFETCSPVCEQTCDRPKPRECRTKCHNGNCVCWPKFVKAVWKGEEYCVPPFQCPVEE